MISDMHTKTNRMYSAMFGDEGAAIPGIAQRVKKLEDSDKKRSGIYTLITAFGAGVALMIKAVIEHFNK
jgi:hypothetical protein